jgi:DNA-binding winged helix-turn-helix (wHTH) protein/TolB-like protein
MGQKTKHFYEFGAYRLDLMNRLLLRDSEVVPLPPKSFDILLALVKESGQVLQKDELMQRVWPDTFVEEANLSNHVFTLRKALGEDKNGAKYIETIPRRGYRFVAQVTEIADLPDDLVVEEHTRSHIIVVEEPEASPSIQSFPVEQTEEAKPPGKNYLAKSLSARKLTHLAFVMGGLLLGLGLVIYFWGSGKSKPQLASPTVKSIAVLPFKPLVGENRNEMLELGMADTLINKLSGIKQLIVRPVSAVRNYTSLEQDPIAAGQELAVDYVVEGNLQMQGNKTRATVRLLSVQDKTAVWTTTCDQACNTIFELQDGVAEQVSRMLRLQLTTDEQQQLAKHYTHNTEAYQLYSMGRYFLNKTTKASLEKAIRYFQQAIDQDRSYALAQAGIAEAHILLGLFNFLPQAEAYKKSEIAAARALEMDNSLAEAHAALGYAKFRYAWNWPAAEAEFKRAIDLNPNSAIAHHWYGEYLTVMQRFDEALVEQQRTQELDPQSLQVRFEIAVRFYFMHQYGQAIDELKKVIEMDRNYIVAYGLLWASYRESGLAAESVAARLEGLKLEGYTSREIGRLQEAFATAGLRGFWEADIALTKRQFSPNQSPVSGSIGTALSLLLAMNHSSLDQKDQAFIWLEKAYLERDSWLPELKADPVWENLRSDPRFTELLQRVGFKQ